MWPIQFALHAYMSRKSTSIPHYAGLSGQYTWWVLEDIFHQTQITFSPSFVLLFLCLLVYWRHISFWFPGRVRWADVVFAAWGSRMSHVAFLLTYTSSLLVQHLQLSLPNDVYHTRHRQAQTDHFCFVHRCPFLRYMFQVCAVTSQSLYHHFLENDQEDEEWVATLHEKISVCLTSETIQILNMSQKKLMLTTPTTFN